MSNKISTNNPVPYASLNDIPPTTPIKPELATTENKVELIHNTDETYINNIVSEGLKDKLDSTRFQNSAISEVSINFDNEKLKKTLIDFIPEHNKVSPTDGIEYAKKTISNSSNSLFLNKPQIENHLSKLGIDIKGFILINYKIDLVGVEHKELATELKEKLKYAIKNDDKSIIDDLNCELKPVGKNNNSCVSIPNTQYPNQNKIEQLKNEIKLSNEKIEKSSKDEEGVFTKFESVDKFLDYVSKNEANIPYGSKFGVSLEGSINPAKLLEAGIKVDIKIEYSFGKGPSYLAHVDLNSQLSSDLVGAGISSTIASYGLSFYKVGQIKEFKDALSEIINNDTRTLEQKINKLTQLIENNSCILSTHSIDLKTTDNSSIKVTTTKGTYPPPPKPTNETIKKIDEGYYKEDLLANDIEIDSKINDFTIKIQMSDLDSVKPSEYKGPIVKLSVEYKKGIKELNPETLKKAITVLKEIVPEKDILDKAINLIDKNKVSFNSLKTPSKTLSLKDSIHVSLELNTDQSGIFLNEFVESSTAKNFKDVKNVIKKLPMYITPAVESTIGIRKQLK